MKDKISKVLITMGLLILIGSFTLSLYSKSIENKSLSNFEEKIKKEDTLSEVLPGDEIGIIEIDSINLKNVIVQSTTKEYLKYYVCHFEESAMPGEEGNFALAGHSSYIYNQVFNNLHKVNMGDKIVIKTINDEFTYIITETMEVQPSDTYVLDQDMSKKEITIVTCTNSGKQRFIVKGELQ